MPIIYSLRLNSLFFNVFLFVDLWLFFTVLDIDNNIINIIYILILLVKLELLNSVSNDTEARNSASYLHSITFSN